MRLGWVFGRPDPVPRKAPCPKLSRATRRQCKAELITEILTQLHNETDEDRHVHEETFDFLSPPAWRNVKINFYRADLDPQSDLIPSSTFKELDSSEFEKHHVEYPNVIMAPVRTFANDLGVWSGFFGSFTSAVTLMVASDPSNKWLRTTRYASYISICNRRLRFSLILKIIFDRIPDPFGWRREESDDLWVRLLVKGYPKANGGTKTWESSFTYVDSNKLIRGALIEGIVLSKAANRKRDSPCLYQCELLALLLCLIQQEYYLRDRDAPAILSVSPFPFSHSVY